MINKYCHKCPLKLLKCKHHNLQGIGNIFSQNVIIISNVDYNATKTNDLKDDKQVREIISTLSSTGGGIEDCYIVPIVRCPENKEIPINKTIVEQCSKYLWDELKKDVPINVIFLGTSYQNLNLINIDFANYIYTRHTDLSSGIIYTYTYSILNKHYKDDVKKVLIDWYNKRNEIKEIMKQYRI